MPSIADIQYREATLADVPAMMKSHSAHSVSGPADPRMTAYLNQQHHPQQALLPRVAYVALADHTVIGYIAGHRTTRHGCGGEVQYLFVSPKFRRRGIATQLFRLMAEWFQSQGVQGVCVALADDSPPEAKPFYQTVGATPLKKYWYAWQDIDKVLDRPR
jgi:GNAT superfamily N-acetyltransferase